MEQSPKRFWFLSILILLVLPFHSACGREEERGNKEGHVGSQLKPVLSVQQKNNGIDFLTVIENHSNHTVTLSFDSSKMFDVSVIDSSDKEVFRHSEGKTYAEEKEQVQIKAGASHIWKAEWKIPAAERKAGIYNVKASFTPRKISPGSVKTENLTLEETLTLQSGAGEMKNNSFRNIHFSGKDGKYKVSGEARVFEASFAYTVTDGYTIFVEKHEQTAEGAPAWAPFSFDINLSEDDLPINGTLMVELFYFSPKDGEKTDILAIPLQTFK
ncbi:BsuPI-related putative proteinase inhibitor [Fictibacillus barbaricus]|uniref:Immunoglobulin-like domain of spore germination n=1 Tax=Fictibacillus barbaricus TaxID=182136 RepID=A0ABS2ZFM0_9BACL|nr:BsuPI-related putative proteinase inhibitor [Fictibacillus barbaricus]MBN3546133.1 hypothetical protein [Fictibacillus barbaricus]GGB58942.1 hypothetical protein GCM10007199_25990 [Fictibacillus barbaricus]